MTSFEHRVFELTNIERRKHSLTALIWDDALAWVARKHSQDLAANNIFSHIGSDGSLPEHRVRRAGIIAEFLGENICGGRDSPEAVIKDWMNSTGHRANILHIDIIYLGVGAAFAPASRLKFYVTQVFGR